MKCIWCGGETREQDRFCPHCGNSLEEAETEKEGRNGEQDGRGMAESAVPAKKGGSAKYWLIGIAVVAAIILIIVLMAGGGTETYTGTDTRWDITVTLKNDDTFEIKKESLITGSVTTITGTYEKLGTNDTVILFKPTSGVSFRCQVQKNIYGTPFLSYSGVFCYKT